MRCDSRLSGLLHVLLHMAHERGPVTSEALAAALQTHPVVIRRTMAGLRVAGFVKSERGHGGGWTIARRLDEITLRDVYVALGSPQLFAIGNRTDVPHCFVEQAVNTALKEAMLAAEALLLQRFAQVTLADLYATFQDGLANRRDDLGLERAHAV